MFENWYQKIVDWFSDFSDRRKLIDDFNRSAREAWVSGVAPVNMKASVSRGYSPYKHQYSKWMASGFRITAYAGMQLSKQQIMLIGAAILQNEVLVRRMVVLGWDTLEIQCDIGNFGCRWQLSDYLAINQ